MIRVFSILLNLLASTALAHEPPVDPLVLGEYEAFSEVESIPASIVETFQTGADFGAGGLAEPEEPFNAFDVVTGGLPCSRLIRGGHVADLWFVHYERGCSRAHTHQLDIFRLENGVVGNSWSYISPLEEPIEVRDLIRFVEEGNECLISPPRYLLTSAIINACIFNNAN